MKVDSKKCIGCGGCVSSCPVEAICFKEGCAFIDVNICINCGMCKSTCPVEAIDEDLD